jgi:PAS domain S-box-containing protein
MPKKNQGQQGNPNEITALRKRLAETEETLDAIRQYLVDAFVIKRSDGEQVVTLSDANFPYRMMVESMNEGAITLIPDGTIFYSNPCFGNMVGISPQKLIGIQFRDLLMAEDQPAFDSVLHAAGQHGKRGEFRIKTDSGFALPVQLSVYTLSTDDGSGIAILALDVAERIRAEEKIRSLAAELTMVEQQERHRISQVLHDDLQQRLFAIRAHLSLLKEKSVSEAASQEQNSSIDQIQDWLSEAITITRNLSVNLSPVVLHGDGLGEAIAWLASQMKEQYGLQVEVEASEDFVQIEEHKRVLLFQAVRELLFNIVKHAGLLQATVRFSQENGKGWIMVSDSGVGFDARATMKDPQVAHGLLIIKDRLGLMGCDMKVDSQPGAGTRVMIGIPMDPGSALTNLHSG